MFLICFFCCAGLCGPAWAVPAAPIVHELTQPDGTKVKAVQWGDEFRHGWETVDGYAIRLDEASGHWKYISRDNAGGTVLMPEKAGIDALPSGLEKGIERRSATAVNLRASRKSPSPPQKVVPPTGTGHFPLMLINFSNGTNTYTNANFKSLLFDNNTYSMKDYYEEVSYGAFTVSGNVAGWYTAGHPHDYYGQDSGGVGNDEFPGTLVREAVQAADDAGFDFTPYDNDNDGYVDIVAIVHRGTGQEASDNASDIWSHSWDLNSAYAAGCSDGGAYTTKSGKIVNSYVMMPEVLVYDNTTSISTMGVFAHEFGHALGLPDLYDTDYSSEGIGDWSIMAGGSWNGVSRPGDRPAHMDAWSKYFLGWVSPVQVTGAQDNQTIRQVEIYPDVYQLGAGSPVSGTGEYFLVENRQQTGFDEALPGAGLLIWHIDEHRATNNKECRTGPGTSCARHYHVALMQADNMWQLEKGTNSGDDGDPYPGSSNNRAFTDSSAPSSKLWNGASSNVSVTNISNSGAAMQADFSMPSMSSTTTTTPGTTTIPGSTTTTTKPTTTTSQPTTTTSQPTTTTVLSTTTSVISSTTTSTGGGSTTTTTSQPTTTTVLSTTTSVISSTTTSTGGGSTTTTTTSSGSTTTTSIAAATTTTTTTGGGKICPATKVLGEDNPKLENLRDFRDSKLAQSAVGCKAIQIYYNNADSINAALERSPALRAVARRVLEVIAPMLGKN